MRRVHVRRVAGAGELSTGAGAAMFLVVLWVLVEYGHRKLS